MPSQESLKGKEEIRRKAPERWKLEKGFGPTVLALRREERGCESRSAGGFLKPNKARPPFTPRAFGRSTALLTP